MSTAGILDTVQELGGELKLQGDKLAYRLPDCPEAREILEHVRRDSAAIKALLRDYESQPPFWNEVQAALPPGVTLVSYQPKRAPFGVTVASVVTNAGKFYRSYLAALAKRLEKPDGYHCPPLADILSKLADAGLQLQIGRGVQSCNLEER